MNNTKIKLAMIDLLQTMERINKGINVEKQTLGHWRRLRDDIIKKLKVIIKLTEVHDAER